MVLLSRSDEKYKMHLTMTALDSLTAAALLKTTQRGRQRGDPLHSWKVRERDRYWTRDPGSQPMLVSPPRASCLPSDMLPVHAQYCNHGRFYKLEIRLRHLPVQSYACCQSFPIVFEAETRVLSGISSTSTTQHTCLRALTMHCAAPQWSRPQPQ